MDKLEIIKKPGLKKVIERLERLEPYQWKLDMGDHGPEFTTAISGLTISVKPCLARRPPISGGNLIYHSLTIQNREGNIRVEYYSIKKKNTEEKEIKHLYDQIWLPLEENRNRELIHSIIELFSEQKSEKQNYKTTEIPELDKVISKLEKVDSSKWDYEIECFGWPKFRVKTDGLLFEIEKRVESIGLINDKYYHTLSIKTMDGSIGLKYPYKTTNTIEKEKIKNFYKNLYEIIKDKHKEFSHKLEEFLSD